MFFSIYTTRSNAKVSEFYRSDVLSLAFVPCLTCNVRGIIFTKQALLSSSTIRKHVIWWAIQKGLSPVTGPSDWGQPFLSVPPDQVLSFTERGKQSWLQTYYYIANQTRDRVQRREITSVTHVPPYEPCSVGLQVLLKKFISVFRMLLTIYCTVARYSTNPMAFLMEALCSM